LLRIEQGLLSIPARILIAVPSTLRSHLYVYIHISIRFAYDVGVQNYIFFKTRVLRQRSLRLYLRLYDSKWKVLRLRHLPTNLWFSTTIDFQALPKEKYLYKFSSWTHTEPKNKELIYLQNLIILFFTVQQTLAGIGLFIVEFSRSHSDTPHSVWLLQTSDRLVAETSTWQHATLTRDTFTPPAVFQPAVPASERPQNHALDGAAIGTGSYR